MKYKAIREMNAQGIYTPEQINNELDRVWVKYNPNETRTVDKETTELMVAEAVNSLGKIGDGQVFVKSDFEKVYKKFDSWNAQKIARTFVHGMITAMVAKDDL